MLDATVSIRERLPLLSWVFGILAVLVVLAAYVSTRDLHQPVAQRCALGVVESIEGAQSYGPPKTWVTVVLEDGRVARVSDRRLQFRRGRRVFLTEFLDDQGRSAGFEYARDAQSSDSCNPM